MRKYIKERYAGSGFRTSKGSAVFWEFREMVFMDTQGLTRIV